MTSFEISNNYPTLVDQAVFETRLGYIGRPLILAQQVFSALSIGLNQPDGSGCGNTSAPVTTPKTQSTLPNDITSVIGFFLSSSALWDWLKLIVYGSVLETFRRLGIYLYYKLYNSFFITAHFVEDDSSFDWMMIWLSQKPSWKRARDVQISTRSFGLESTAVLIEGEEEDTSSLATGKRQLAFLPSQNSVHSFWYKGRWVRATRSVRQATGYYNAREEILELCIFSMDHRILNELLIEAKKAYLAAQENTISIYTSDSHNSWHHVASRPKRPLTSIVLDPGIKDLLVDDARDFLASKAWYSARGIPFRRGYLLYGAPGSGKTSIIHSLAGELGLDVYIISLSRSGLDDTALSELISDLPERCIALMEDIDAAFSQTLKRDLEKEDDQAAQKEGKGDQAGSTTSRVSLSGLLNALDGVGAQEGRILFATTNKYSSLDPALCRPGRMDIHINFKLASKYQASELYQCFYLPDSEAMEQSKTIEKDASSDDSGYSSANEKDACPTPPSPTSSDGATTIPNPEPVSFSGHTHRDRAPKLSASQVASLAAKFAHAIPEREFSMASLQGYLMGYKTRPYDAISGAPAWVEKERAEIAKRVKTAPVSPVPATEAKTKESKVETPET
ncbi:hypothetical protein GALMADRAFT_241190 [Galerina marginata CBS 339.88]|uniref:AAA+ ATPase domain-containing protein n=1 Tax=Galerina marginata (strain CBS 339.88) TaxID=685588 RepID=A0A067TEH7_GALM3|nr:hypothetical protein GALMADRAFT_241190 [Galerina marginata CBS 339.88]